MNRASFWQLVELLTNAGGADYWPERGRAQATNWPLGGMLMVRDFVVRNVVNTVVP